MLLLTLSYGLVFFVGLILGSFYTALAQRIFYFFYGEGRKKIRRLKGSVWKVILLSSSFCFHPKCQKRIAASDLLPLWSYLRNRGRCRYCKKSIGISTLLGEAYMGCLSLFLFTHGNGWPTVLLSLLFCGHLYISLITDSRLLILDPENALFLFLWAISYVLMSKGFHLIQMQSNLLAFAGSFLCFGLLFLAGRFRQLGFGDVILASVIALFIGLPWCLIVFQLAAAASIVYIVLIKRERRAPAPLGAAMALSFFVVLPISALFE